MPGGTVKSAKSLLFVAVAVVIFVQGTVADGMTMSDWAGTGAALVTALGIYVVPNIRDAGVLEYAKAGVAVLGAVFAGLVLALTDNYLSDVEVYTVFIAACGAVGVAVVPNTGNPVAIAVPVAPRG